MIKIEMQKLIVNIQLRKSVTNILLKSFKKFLYIFINIKY